jgi:hypothetical protein
MSFQGFLRSITYLVALVCAPCTALANNIEVRLHHDQGFYWCFTEAARLYRDEATFMSTIEPWEERAFLRPEEVEDHQVYGIWALQPDGRLTALICAKTIAFEIMNPKPAVHRLWKGTRLYVEENTADCRQQSFSSPSRTVSVAFENERFQVSWISSVNGRSSCSDAVQLCVGGFNQITLQ